MIIVGCISRPAGGGGGGEVVQHVSVCLSVCLSPVWLAGCTQGKCGARLEKQPRCAAEQAGRQQDGSKAGRTQSPPARYGRSQTGRRDPGSRGTTHAAFTPAHRAAPSPSSPPVCLFSPLPLSPLPPHRGQQCLACFVMRARGWVHRRQRHNQIKSDQPLPSPSPDPSQSSGVLVLSRQSGKDSLDSV